VKGPPRVLAVDLGATSVRVAAVHLDASAPDVEVLHRWQHSPVAAADGSYRWNWPRIVSEVEKGLERGMVTGPVASIGVDGWGVDYGLIDKDGQLVALPHSYRDPRTEKWQTTAEAIGVGHLYEVTGIQLMGINTIFQLAAHDRSEIERATRLLLLPDLLVHQLGGSVGAERSNASTTSLMDARTGEWAHDLIETLSLEQSLFPDVVSAGRLAGRWRGVPLHLVGSHDTASAFLGMPGGSTAGTVFVSTGTWVIVGIERSTVDTSSAAREANFSNEAGALGGTRFLKNVVGFWILDQCRLAWNHPPIELLLDEASSVTDPVPTFDVGDARFVTPLDMEQEIRSATGLPKDTPRSLIVRSVLESIVDGIARVISQLGRITGTSIAQVAMVGGGARAPLIQELLTTRTGLRVVTGSPEATALGNAVAQGIALGHFDDIAEARRWLEATGRSSGDS
jgi:rhamnulokinase